MDVKPLLVLALCFFLGINLAVAQNANPPEAQPPEMANPQAIQSEGEGAIVSGSEADLLDGIIEDYDYRPEDKRDPFKPFVENEAEAGVTITGPAAEPVLPLERFNLDDLTLVGIIWGSDEPKAMFVDPASRSHIVTLNDRIGQNRGYVAAIREGEVIVVEPFGRDGTISYQTRVITLQRPE